MEKLNKKIKQINRFLFHHKGMTSTITIGISGVFMFYKYCSYSIGKSMRVSAAVVEIEKSKEYLYLNPDKEKILNMFYKHHNQGTLSSITREHIHEILPAFLARLVLWVDKNSPDLAEEYVSPWSVLRQATSQNKRIQLKAVESIATYKAWNDETLLKHKKAKQKKLEDLLSMEEIEKFDLDAELRTLAQAVDPRTAVGLARTNNVDLRLFLPPPPLEPLSAEEEIEDFLRDLLTILPQNDVEKCVQYFTSNALSKSENQKHKRGGLWCFGGNGIKYHRGTAPQEEVERHCLHALSKHSVFENHCKVMVENGILQLLQRIKTLRPYDDDIQEKIARIVSNICIYQQFHPQLYQSGWISLFAELSKSEVVALRIQATRGLANLDRDEVTEVFHDGVYILYPRFRSKLKPEADIVFVHGLMGGAFYSWRKKDHLSSDNSDNTQCWPETWLPHDLPGCRIMCVDFDSSITEWKSVCPFDDDKKTISYRSRRLLDALVKAGLGRRPIVWVAHSMGGLIVKHMMLDAEESPNLYGRIRSQTKGIIFFSTPHKGSKLADYSRPVRRLLFPTIEVMELSQDSPKLNQLNEVLKRMVEDDDLRVLSFGETQSTDIGLGRLVPLRLDIVPPDSANPRVGEFILADTNHLNVCKPASRQSSIYQRVVNFIRLSIGLVEQSLEEDIADDDFHFSREPDMFYII